MKKSERNNIFSKQHTLPFLMICLFLLSFSYIGKAQEVSVTITVKNIKETKGSFLISLYNDVTNFLKEGKEFRKQKVKVLDSIMQFTFAFIPQGTYGVVMYHDANDDGKCNKNFLGIPKEGFGFSRNYRPILLPPSFNDVKIELKQNENIIINLIYL